MSLQTTPALFFPLFPGGVPDTGDARGRRPPERPSSGPLLLPAPEPGRRAGRDFCRPHGSAGALGSRARQSSGPRPGIGPWNRPPPAAARNPPCSGPARRAARPASSGRSCSWAQSAELLLTIWLRMLIEVLNLGVSYGIKSDCRRLRVVVSGRARRFCFRACGW